MELRSIVPRFGAAKLTGVEVSEPSVVMAVLVNARGMVGWGISELFL